MRNRVFWNSPRTRFISCLTLVGLMALALAGCGGGSGGGPGPGPVIPPGGSNVSISGTVKDTSAAHSPVVNALVGIVGTTLSTRTDSSGSFSFASVPSTATRFTVSNPDPTTYFSYANFNGKLYDVIKCNFPLPTLHAGSNPVVEVDLYQGGSSPSPPPPTGGCP